MSNKDYTKFSNQKIETKVVEVQNGVVETENVVEETPEVEFKIGVVANCRKLNVRKAPFVDADIACVINEDTFVEVNELESTEDFYKVCTAAGVNGYCMKDFIEIE